MNTLVIVVNSLLSHKTIIKEKESEFLVVNFYKNLTILK